MSHRALATLIPHTPCLPSHFCSILTTATAPTHSWNTPRTRLPLPTSTPADLAKVTDHKKKKKKVHKLNTGGRHLPGQQIEARFHGGGTFYPGRVVAVNADGTVNIQYADGDQEMDVARALVRKAQAEKPSVRGVLDQRDGEDSVAS
jgi:hypothetical protein